MSPADRHVLAQLAVDRAVWQAQVAEALELVGVERAPAPARPGVNVGYDLAS